MAVLSESIWNSTLQPLKTCLIKCLAMATKLGRVVNYHEGLPLMELLNPLFAWPCKITWQTKNIYTPRVLMVTKLGRVVTYHEGLPPMKLLDPLITWYCKITWQTKTIMSANIFTTTVPAATKLGRLMTYLKGLLSI